MNDQQRPDWPTSFNYRDGGWRSRRAAGKELRKQLPRTLLGQWQPTSDRPDPLATIEATFRDRMAELLPLAVERMSASCFAFFRGTAALMADDQGTSPATGQIVQLCGDAHLANFGLYPTAQGEIVFDLNDFDETARGPWEWDLKRLVASIVVALRERGLRRKERAEAVAACAAVYRETANQLEELGLLELWHQHRNETSTTKLSQMAGQVAGRAEFEQSAIFRRMEQKSLERDDRELLRTLTHDQDGHWQFVDAPPLLAPASDHESALVMAGLASYLATLLPERQQLLRRYQAAAVARRVGGIGSAGVRSYLVLLFGSGLEDPLFLQLKQSRPSSVGAYTPQPSFANQGERVVSGHRLLQAYNDVLLGWTTIEGRDFFVRQFRDTKGSIPIDRLEGVDFIAYAGACARLLARAHARSGDIAGIAGYCGRSSELDVALSQFAECYADQVANDYAAFLQATKAGRWARHVPDASATAR